MINSINFYFYLVVSISLYFSSVVSTSDNLKVSIVSSIKRFYKLYDQSHAEELTLLEKGNHRYYILGERKSGDTLIAQSEKQKTLPSEKNIGIKFKYPSTSLAWPPQITYVIIGVDQTSNFGRAYVVKGGLYQSSIVIVVEVYNSHSFSYNAEFYGIY